VKIYGSKTLVEVGEVDVQKKFIDGVN